MRNQPRVPHLENRCFGGYFFGKLTLFYHAVGVAATELAIAVDEGKAPRVATSAE
jgi:hypothetical protein